MSKWLLKLDVVSWTTYHVLAAIMAEFLPSTVSLSPSPFPYYPQTHFFDSYYVVIDLSKLLPK